MASNFTQREQLGYEIDQDINELRKLDARIKELEKKKRMRLIRKFYHLSNRKGKDSFIKSTKI